MTSRLEGCVSLFGIALDCGFDVKIMLVWFCKICVFIYLFMSKLTAEWFTRWRKMKAYQTVCA